MPVRVYLKGREFDAESIRVLGIAFECARSALHVFPSDEVLSEAIAARIIELARTGERDPEKLCDFAIAALKTPPAHGAMIYQGIEYQVRASLGRDEWVLLIYFPDKPDGKATVSKFTGTRAVVAGAARRKIDNWLSEKKRKALQPKRPAEDRAATTRQHVSHTAKPPRPRVRRCRHQIQ